LCSFLVFWHQGRVARLEVDQVVNLSIVGLNGVEDVLNAGKDSVLFAEQCAVKGLHVTGLDANPEMLPVAQKYVPLGKFQVGIAEKLPFSDGF
jgi:hypothetical protein